MEKHVIKQRSHLKAMIIQTLCIFLYFSLMQLTTWIPMRYWSAWGGGNFLDTWQVLRFTDCYQDIGLDIYRTDVGQCSNYLYGRLLVQLLALLDVSTNLTPLIGYGFLLLLSFSISNLFLVSSKSELIVIMIVLLSPPIQLLAERGNFDILIIFGLVIATRLTLNGFQALALVIIFITTLIKFYTAPVLLIFMLSKKPLRIKALSGFLFVCSVILILRDIKITESSYPQGATGQFGIKVWGEYLNLYNWTSGSEARNLFLGIVILFLCCIVMMSMSRIVRQSQDIAPIWGKGSGQFFIVTFVCCYLMGMNFDYRLTILAFALLAYLKSINELNRHWLILFLTSSLWLSFPSGGLQPIGDLVLELGIAILIISIWISRKKFNQILR
jgi:hypothetical protein